jgi:hypothetical protein
MEIFREPRLRRSVRQAVTIGRAVRKKRQISSAEIMGLPGRTDRVIPSAPWPTGQLVPAGVGGSRSGRWLGVRTSCALSHLRLMGPPDARLPKTEARDVEIAAEGLVGAAPAAVAKWLTDLENHWVLADRFVELVSLEHRGGVGDAERSACAGRSCCAEPRTRA